MSVVFLNSNDNKNNDNELTKSDEQKAIENTALLNSMNRDLKIQNVCGSTAGAGSGTFHKYRQHKRREMFRLQKLKKEAKKDELNEKLKKRRRDNENELQRKAKKRKKNRDRKKSRKKKYKQKNESHLIQNNESIAIHKKDNNNNNNIESNVDDTLQEDIDLISTNNIAKTHDTSI